MVYWKIDDETIRCLINKDEIGKMGFDINVLTKDASAMDDFLEAIIDNSHNYIQWNTENGIQNYAARALPADQYLITISCTFQDVAINRDLDQILRMFHALNDKITEERIDEVRNLSGEDKQKAFTELSRDLHDICVGNLKQEEESREEHSQTEDSAKRDHVDDSQREITQRQIAKDETAKEAFPDQTIIFDSMSQVLQFVSLLDERYFYPSQLGRFRDTYVLLVDLSGAVDKVNIITFLITAEEFGADCEKQDYDRYFLEEHGEFIIREDAIRVLHSLA